MDVPISNGQIGSDYLCILSLANEWLHTYTEFERQTTRDRRDSGRKIRRWQKELPESPNEMLFSEERRTLN